MAQDLDMPYTTVNSWWQRGIPPKHFIALIAHAKRRGHDLSFEELAAISDDLRAPKTNRGAA